MELSERTGVNRRMKTIADIMTSAPIVVEVPGNRNDAINIMVRNKLTGLPVVRASDGKLMGIVSRRDIFRKFDEDQLSMIMQKSCVTISPDKTVEEAAEIFSKYRFHRLPVIDDGKLVGIVTPTDLLREVAKSGSKMIAGDVINSTCVTAYEGDPLSYAISAMRVSDVPALLILNAKGDLTGILTDRDLFNDQLSDEEALAKLGVNGAELVGIRNVLPLFYTVAGKQTGGDKLVSQYMVRNPLTIFRKTPLPEVARIMLENDFGQLPIHGTGNELIGMIYDVDVLRAMVKE